MMRRWWPPGRRLVVLILGVAVLALVGLKYVFVPQVHMQQANQAKLKDLRQKLHAAGVAAEARHSEIETAGQEAGQWQELRPLFDYVADDGLAYVYIGMKAVAAPVEIVSVTPAAVDDKGTYLEFPVTVETRGGYLEVCNFIRQMENAPHLIEIKTLNISSLEAREITGGAEVARPAPDNSAEVLKESTPAQSGEVMAILHMVTYSGRSPATGIPVAELVSDWLVGRDNAFRTPGALSPYPGAVPVEYNCSENISGVKRVLTAGEE